MKIKKLISLCLCVTGTCFAANRPNIIWDCNILLRESVCGPSRARDYN